jgi:hypothetical protein
VFRNGCQKAELFPVELYPAELYPFGAGNESRLMQTWLPIRLPNEIDSGFKGGYVSVRTKIRKSDIAIIC